MVRYGRSEFQRLPDVVRALADRILGSDKADYQLYVQFWAHAGLVGALVAVSCLIGGLLVVLSACRSGAPQAQQFRDLSFDIAPTGDKIIFTGKGKGNWNLYFLDLTTKKVTLLAETDQWERHPQFSPDGKFILYTAADNPQDPLQWKP